MAADRTSEEPSAPPSASTTVRRVHVARGGCGASHASLTKRGTSLRRREAEHADFSANQLVGSAFVLVDSVYGVTQVA